MSMHCKLACSEDAVLRLQQAKVCTMLYAMPQMPVVDVSHKIRGQPYVAVQGRLVATLPGRMVTKSMSPRVPEASLLE